MEHVLVVRAQLLAPYITRRGVASDPDGAITETILAQHAFLPRPEAEEDPEWKQIVSYVIIRRGDEIFYTRRLAKGSEVRLRGLVSIGVGGHINADEDGDDRDILMRGLLRELGEEVALSGSMELTPLGYLNDDTNGVGSVHLGLMYLLETDGEVQVLETEKLAGAWIAQDRLGELVPEMETWSQLAMEVL